MKKYLNSFKQIVGVQNMITDPFDLKPLNQDWQRFYQGKSELAVTPTSTKMVSEVLQFCNQNNIKVVPQGGNTSFVGGATPVQDELILSLRKMNNILEFDTTTSIVTAESGVILQTMNDYLQAYRYQMPWDLGARGSCQLGGNIATNAGGLNVVKNGPLRNYILGLEVVLPSGKILNLLNKNRKDNTGTDLKQLFIGSEGTLGIITQANVLCTPIPEQRQVFFLELKDFDEVIYLLRSAKQFEQLGAFEFMEGRILQRCLPFNPQLKAPFEFKDDKYYVLIEICGQQIELEYYFERLLKHTEQIVFNQNESELQAMWRWRESVPENLHKMGHVLTYDLSIPPDKFEWFAEQVYYGRKGPYNAFYGHLGDGNIHYNIIFESVDEMHKEQHRVEEKIIKLTKDLNGSISAEHGIGQLKRHYMEVQKGKETFGYMQELKRLFDPNNILNPEKLL
ncbi:unnamed protein product [Paramecium pentaurelia]|uniref:FAD-binding PCMH-type domain-containing protein n=1 Tax=Paramecium pentaurelia TaxID=43138 RepID=A0A8S1Y609_9CILI|nr:unnamed protein product [Paramecium pentaurelia]